MNFYYLSKKIRQDKTSAVLACIEAWSKEYLLWRVYVR